jgi:hypothetical protein
MQRMRARTYNVVVCIVLASLIGLRELNARAIELTCWAGGYSQDAWVWRVAGSAMTSNWSWKWSMIQMTRQNGHAFFDIWTTLDSMPTSCEMTIPFASTLSRGRGA